MEHTISSRKGVRSARLIIIRKPDERIACPVKPRLTSVLQKQVGKIITYQVAYTLATDMETATAP